MISKFSLAASALVFFTAVAASSASAEVNVDLNLNLGGGYSSYYPESYQVYQPYPLTDEGYDDYDNADYGYEYTPVKKWNRYHDRYRIVQKRVWVCN